MRRKKKYDEMVRVNKKKGSLFIVLEADGIRKPYIPWKCVDAVKKTGD